MQLSEYFEIGMTLEEYTGLLDERQRQLHEHHGRRVEIGSAAVDRLRAAGPFKVLVITEPWCGDSLANLPVILELCRHAGIELRIILRDQHLELIDRYLTHSGRSIPIAIVLDEKHKELFHWGPRPAPAQAIFEEHREEVAAGRIAKAEVHKKIRAFYGRDKGRTIIREFLVGFGVAAS